MTCMSGNRQFVDTNVLAYAHDVTAGDKHTRARAMILRSAKELGCATVHSEDLNPGQDYDGVQVRNPFPA